MSRSRRVFSNSALLTSAARIGVIGLAMLCMTGCASKQASHDAPYRVAAPNDQMKVDMEEDGRPAQPAPRHPNAIPDDPSQPWSPNYGRSRAGKHAENAVPQPASPAPASAPDARPQTKRQKTRFADNAAPVPATKAPGAPVQTAGMDPDEIIRRAIAEHEMRRGD